MQEADHGAFAAAQVQAVVPVRPEALADAVGTHLSGGEVQNALHMLVDRALAALGIADHLVHEARVPGLLHILHNGADQPQGVVRTGILQPVNDLALVRGRHHRGRLEGLLLFLRLKPLGLKQMQAVALVGQSFQKLGDPHPAPCRVGVEHHHGVLGRIPVAQAHPAADLDEGGKPGEHDVDLALVQVPDVQLGIHSLVGGGNLQAFQPVVPEFRGLGEVPVRFCLGVLPAHGLAGFQIALAQQEQKPLLLARLQGDGFHQAAAVIAALPGGAGAFARFHSLGVPLRAVVAQESVPAAVEAVRGKVRGKELEAVLLIIEVLLNDTVGVPAAGGIEAHLEVLVVHGHLMEAEFQIGKYGEVPFFAGIVAQAHVPEGPQWRRTGSAGR